MDKKLIEQLMFELLGESYCRSECTAILYGSRKSPRDVDILLIQERLSPTASFVAGQVDIFVIDRKRFVELVQLLDLIVIEPLLSGIVLFGDLIGIESIKSKILKTKPTIVCSEHACLRGLEETLSARQMFLKYQRDLRSELLEWSFHNLAFGISYMSFAKYYCKKNSIPCTLSTLIRKGDILLPKFWLYRNRIKTGQYKIKPEAIEQWIHVWLSTLTNNVEKIRDIHP